MMGRLSSLLPQFIKEKIKRTIISRRYSVKLHKNVIVSFTTQFEGHALINRDCDVSGAFIGFGTFVAPCSRLIWTKVGRYCSIGQHVKTRFGLHPSRSFVSTHPAFFSLQKQAGFTFMQKQTFEEHRYVDKDKKYVVEIGNDVWIGNEVKILDGVKIGDGAIVGLGSIVTRDVEPYSINVGIPAKKIGRRFNEEQIQFLLQFKWWERDFEWLKAHAYVFCDIDEFVLKFCRQKNFAL